MRNDHFIIIVAREVVLIEGQVVAGGFEGK